MPTISSSDAGSQPDAATAPEADTDSTTGQSDAGPTGEDQETGAAGASAGAAGPGGSSSAGTGAAGGGGSAGSAAAADGGEPDAGPDSGVLAEDPDDDAGAPEPPRYDYENDVAPILARYCVSCHGPSDFAPFRLDSYSAAVTYAASVAGAMQARIMPPCAKTSPTCGPSQDQIDLVIEWSTTGRIERLPARSP